jgi:hypothetical protein
LKPRGSRKKAPGAGRLKVRGYLIHLTHYDPWWMKTKSEEKPFDLALGLEAVDELARQGFNALLVGVSDGVLFKSHPELAKPYSVPMEQLKELAARARARGLSVIPKLNFSKSEINGHDLWSRRPGAPWYEDFDSTAYFNKGFDCIDEIIEACGPERYFHIGMDEDHERSHRQYILATGILRKGLKKRGLTTVAWSDSSIGDGDAAEVHREKSRAAEKRIPTDVVRVLWNYRDVPAKEMKSLRKRGFVLWGAPGSDPGHVEKFREALLEAGGTGLVMTFWRPCRPENRGKMLEQIRTLGPLYGG